MTTTLEHLKAEPQHWHNVHGTRVPHWVIGQGPDLLFVHGWPLDSRTWRNVVDGLKAHFTCHLIDLPGAGRSEWSGRTKAGVYDQADVIAHVIDAIPSGRVGLVGHDSGGTFARFATAMRPEYVSGLVLGNTEIPGHHPWRIKALFAAAKSRHAHGMLRHMASSRAGQYMLLRDSMVDRELMHGEFARLFFEPISTDPKFFEGALLMPLSCPLEDFDKLAQAHPDIICSVHLVWGACDPWFPLGKCRAMSAQFGGEVTLSVVKGCKLLVHEDEPERFAAEILDHFAQVQPSHLPHIPQRSAPQVRTEAS